MFKCAIFGENGPTLYRNETHTINSQHPGNRSHLAILLQSKRKRKKRKGFKRLKLATGTSQRLKPACILSTNSWRNHVTCPSVLQSSSHVLKKKKMHFFCPLFIKGTDFQNCLFSSEWARFLWFCCVIYFSITQV